MSEIATVSPFEALGTDLRFGTTEDGTPFVLGADMARVMDYRSAADAARLLDEDEKGTRIVRTLGGDQRMTVFYEDGIWELIFRSGKPEAKAIKKRVKEILAQLRQGAVVVPAQRAELSRRELAQMVIEEADRADAAEAKVAELEPAAHSWQTLATATGDFMVADAAKILCRDPAINVGQNRLFRILGEWGWTYRALGDNRWRTKQSAIEAGLVSEIPQSHYGPRSGELVMDAPQVRVTVKGLGVLHQRLGGLAPLALPFGQENR